MPDVTLQSAKTEDRIIILSNTAKLQIAKTGLKVEELDAKDLKALKIVELMAKNKKPLDFVASFDGKWFTLTLKIGSWKHEFNSINLIDDTSIKDRKQVMKNLINLGVATQKQLDALNERNLID